MWSEDQGNKGSQEVSTCVAKFIREEVPDGVKILNLYADKCAGFYFYYFFSYYLLTNSCTSSGQNKNSIVVSMLGDSVQEHPTLDEINLKFLEVGHTYMECDSMHSVIERAARDKQVFAPKDWYKIVRQAKKTGHQYNVQVLQYNQFLNYKNVKNHVSIHEKIYFNYYVISYYTEKKGLLKSRKFETL